MRELLLVWLTSCVFLADATTKTHTCIPSGHDELCLLGNIYLDFNDTIQHIFPKNYSMIRIANYGLSRALTSIIPRFDSVLHTLLGRPAVLEIIDVEMEELEIPQSLRHGCFVTNNIEQFTVEHGGNSPALVFLDLTYNHITNISNLSSLVNLEALYLGGNQIRDIDPNALKPLTKLRYLSLMMNMIHQFSAKLYPASLVDLQLYSNKIDRLNYTDLDFPLLEVLNLERNNLESIDVAALLRVMPKLNILQIGGNSFREEDLRAVIAKLEMRNISYKSEGDDKACYYHEEYVEGVCLQPRRDPMGVVLAVVFTVMLVAVGVVFVLATRWVFHEMNK